jgi:hypothetical protein
MKLDQEATIFSKDFTPLTAVLEKKLNYQFIPLWWAGQNSLDLLLAHQRIASE